MNTLKQKIILKSYRYETECGLKRKPCIDLDDLFEIEEIKQLPIHNVSQQSEQLFCKCGSVKNGGYRCMRTDCDNTLQAFMQNNCG